MTLFYPPAGFHPPPAAPLRPLSTLSIRHFAPPTRNTRAPRSLVAPPTTPPASKIAVIGGGLAALATAYHLQASTSRYLRKRRAAPPQVSLLTPRPASTGASAAAAGLLHPFSPRVKKLAWQGRRGVAAAEHLLSAVRHFSAVRFHVQPGLLRLAVSDRLRADFLVAANRFPAEVEYLDACETARRFPGVDPLPAVFLPRAHVVDTRAYMRALWAACRARGVRHVPEAVRSVSEILGRAEGLYDTVVVCAGAGVRGISDLAHVPITPCRGQNVLLREAAVPVPVIGGKYVVPDYFGRGVMAGATFEYADDQPMDAFLAEGGKTDVPRAVAELREPVQALVPGLFAESEVLGACAGVRALPPRSEAGAVPIACRVGGVDEDLSVWVLSALGSRGLLHHAYLGRVMAHAVVAGNEKLLPVDARRFNIALGAPVERLHRVEEDTVSAAVHAQ